MKYRQTGTGPGDGIGTTKTKDGNLLGDERAVYITGASEAMIYRRRLKDILAGMLAANPTLQKIHKGEPIAESELKTLTSTILTATPASAWRCSTSSTVAQPINCTSPCAKSSAWMPMPSRNTSNSSSRPSSLTAQQVRFMNLLKNYIASTAAS